MRPACFQCIRADRAIECEYGDDLNKSDTQILYERLASLEKRYRDLQTIKGRSKNNANTRQLRGQSRSGAQLSRSNSVPKTHGSQVPSRREDSGRPGRSGMKQPLSARSSPLTRSDSPTSETSDGSFGQVPYAQPSGLMFGGPSVSTNFVHDLHLSNSIPSIRTPTLLMPFHFPFRVVSAISCTCFFQGSSDVTEPIEEPFGLSQSAVHHLSVASLRCGSLHAH